MTAPTSTLRRLLAPATATALVALSVLVPMLDAAGGDARPTLETEHDTRCVIGHDHTICTQTSANRALPRATTGEPPAVAARWVGDVGYVDEALPRSPRPGRHSRAPPLARA